MTKLSRLSITNGKATMAPVVEPPPKPPKPKPPRGWKFDQLPAEIEASIRAAIPHYLAIRAAGSTPTEGGPSFPIATRTAESFAAAADLALEFWPAAEDFEIIGSDSMFPTARLATDGLPPTAVLLRLAATIQAIRTLDPARIAPAGWTTGEAVLENEATMS